ncbi:hypothetical protein MNBD_GAMMA22-1727 [hydrothermal vent metagenome]|uniref:Uncharacterized protein n=1 Tax=hydrothermal vent metagenome TaxID=652676 RepID=A0A3B0ZXC9_9ZZZZ
MTNDLKFPLTAAVSFLFGGLLFYPWVEKSAVYTKHEQKILIVKKIDYQFDALLLSSSNLAIKNQLKNNNIVEHKTPEVEAFINSDASAMAQYLAQTKQQSGAKQKIDVQKTVYRFPARLLASSNSAIQKQLASYRTVVKVKTNNTAGMVNDTALSNVDIESELTPVPDDNDIDNPIVENNIVVNQETETELLLSNSAHEHEDSDDEDFSRVLVYMNPNYMDSGFSSDHSLHGEEDDDDEDFSQVLAYTNYNYSNTDGEQDEDEDEYGSERVVFNHEPYYFTESFENNLNNSLLNKKIDVPNVEDIHETSASDVAVENADSEVVIEEIEFYDDGKIVTSAAN